MQSTTTDDESAAPAQVAEAEAEAARALADALALVAVLHHAGNRARHRGLLERAILLADRALALDGASAIACSTLAKAHAARAEDALHGAGQISLGAQRAPTIEACDDGWERVESIVAVAEDSARAALAAAQVLERRAATLKPSVVRAARTAAQRAQTAARAARALVVERNHAYTFHTDYGFSFGEGWYLAAAAVLAGVSIQLEPGKPATAQAEWFLREAGLGDRLLPHRSRPRANKHTTSVIAGAFRADAKGAQTRLREAFLRGAPIAPSVREWIDARVPPDARAKVLVWIRDGAHHAGRNTDYAELVELVRRVQQAGVVPVLVGDAIRDGAVPDGAVDLILFWKDPVFRQLDARRAQLQFFEHLRAAHGVVGQVGVTTAGMDGPALLGMPTAYLTETSNVRMREWVGAVPGYEEIVRDGAYLERVSDALRRWTTANTNGE